MTSLKIPFEFHEIQDEPGFPPSGFCVPHLEFYVHLSLNSEKCFMGNLCEVSAETERL